MFGCFLCLKLETILTFIGDCYQELTGQRLPNMDYLFWVWLPEVCLQTLYSVHTRSSASSLSGVGALAVPISSVLSVCFSLFFSLSPLCQSVSQSQSVSLPPLSLPVSPILLFSPPPLHPAPSLISLSFPHSLFHLSSHSLFSSLYLFSPSFPSTPLPPITHAHAYTHTHTHTHTHTLSLALWASSLLFCFTS